MTSELKEAIIYGGMFCMTSMLVFAWGLFDLKAKLKKIDKVDSIEAILPEIKRTLELLNSTMHEAQIEGARKDEQIKTLFKKYAELELQLYRIQNK